MSVYKLTCETGKIYYGATGNTIEQRKSKGHYHCSCKDFINPKIELVETVDNLDNLYEREKYYIQNFECVNINGSIIDQAEYHKIKSAEYRKRYPERAKESIRKGLLPFNCPDCGKQTSKKHIRRHQRSNLCKNNIV